VLFDLGVLGLTADHRILVSDLYVARNTAGRGVEELSGQALLEPRRTDTAVDPAHIGWHSRQVFKAERLAAR
jgi:putative restriction endonuclease